MLKEGGLHLDLRDQSLFKSEGGGGEKMGGPSFFLVEQGGGGA